MAPGTSAELYYLARTLSQQLGAGRGLRELRASVGIHLLDFDLFSDTPAQRAQALWRFEMRDQTQPEVTLGNVLQLNLIELKKADRLGLAPGPLSAWVTFFEHWREDATMATIEHAPIREALNRVRRLSADEEAQRLAFVRERALRDELSFLKEAREEGGGRRGRAPGRTPGRAPGRRAPGRTAGSRSRDGAPSASPGPAQRGRDCGRHRADTGRGPRVARRGYDGSGSFVRMTEPLRRHHLSAGNKLARALWQLVWRLLDRPTPRPMHAWRCLLPRLFGARLGKAVHPYPSAASGRPGWWRGAIPLCR